MALFSVDLEAIRQYIAHSNREIARVERNLKGLSADDQAELIRTPEEQVGKMQEAVNANVKFLEQVSTLLSDAATSMTKAELDKVREAGVPSHKSVEKMLWLVVREWSKEGEEERSECFTRLLGALETHLSSAREEAVRTEKPPPVVLCPGAQLARLPFEVQRAGYRCEACEERSLYYFASEFVRANGAESEANLIQPYALATCNRFRATDNVRHVLFPEVPVTTLPQVRLGEFTRMYNTVDTRATFDAVLTSFCLDTTGNIFRFVRTVAHVVRPGGLWANFGPLAFDLSHDEAHGLGVEVSWEELKYAISCFFELKEEAFVDSLYGENGKSMMQFQYTCIFFSAIRNNELARGFGEQ